MSSVTGIAGYAVYLPGYALASTRFGDPGDMAVPVRRARSVASYDEDAVTLGVEAGRRVGADLRQRHAVLFATSEPPYLDKSSASTVHAALDLPADVAAVDLGGLRCGAAALRLALLSGGAAVLADVRTSAPGAPDELGHGDAAAAFVQTGADTAAALLVGSASATLEVLDRWRAPGEAHARVWDERFTAEVLRDAGLDAATRALAQAGLERADHVVVSCANPRAATQLRTALGGDRSDAALEALTGYTGTAHIGVLLADALDRCSPGDVVLAVSASDGADAFVFRAGAGIAAANRGPRVRAQLEQRTFLAYDRYLRWRGLLNLQGARRPDPAPPASPPMLRRREWKYALVGARCTKCAAVTTPPGRVCAACGAVDAAEAISLRELPCTVVSVSVDRLTPTPDTAVVLAVVDIDGGGRRSVHVTDVPAAGIHVGDRLVPTFRRLSSTDAIHNYFWKVRPREGS